MINIRTVTYAGDPGFPVDAARMIRAGQAAIAVREALQRAGYTVQTLRFASRPLGDLTTAPHAVSFGRDLQGRGLDAGFDFVAVGPVRPSDPSELWKTVPDVLAATTATFASAIIASRETGIDMAAVQGAASIIHRCACIGTDGFGNLRFAALANVPPGVPFLPAAYHDDGAPSISIGVEGAPAAVYACTEATSLDEAQDMLLGRVEIEARRIGLAVDAALRGTGLTCSGLDFSLAPFPEAGRSLGTAIERLTGGRAGDAGTLAAAAWLASVLDRAHFPRVGFSGLFLPVFEDAVLAARAAEGLLTTSDLLLYAAVCGTGLDTVPLPGDMTAAEIAPILLDVAALALRLDKPLTARLMPIPGRQAGDEVRFDFPYFAPSRVLAPRSLAGSGLLVTAQRFDVPSRASLRANR